MSSTLAQLRARRETLVRERLAKLPPAGSHPYAFCRTCGRIMLAPKVRRTCDRCGDVLPIKVAPTMPIVLGLAPRRSLFVQTTAVVLLSMLGALAIVFFLLVTGPRLINLL